MHVNNTSSFQHDSLLINRNIQDTIAVSAKLITDSISGPKTGHIISATATYSRLDSAKNDSRKILHQNEMSSAAATLDTSNNSLNKKEIVKVIDISQSQYVRPVFDRFHLLYDQLKSIDYKPKQFWTEKNKEQTNEDHLHLIPHLYQRSQYNWALLIGLIAILLLLGLKTYYQKFVNQVLNTLVNFQLADKMLREKNIIARRAFFMMNINFVLMFGLFVMLLADFFNIYLTGNHFYNYLIFLGIIVVVLLTRLLVLYTSALLFNSLQAVVEHIHISYLINKNLGLALLPLVFAAMYATGAISHILLFTGLILFALANIYKLIRSFQIIIRNGVLLYYAILYLCTLELLPLVIGSKILISFR